jgi:hypothetical protein
MKDGSTLGAALVVTVAVLGLHAGCQGKDVGVCGNALVEAPEECDCGTDPQNLPLGCYKVNGADNSGCTDGCELRAVQTTSIILQWSINGPGDLGSGSFDSCLDVGASWVDVHVEGPGGFVADQHNSCGTYQATFTEAPQGWPLVAGLYSAEVTISNADGTPLAPTVLEEFAVAERVTNELGVDLPLESFYAFDTFHGELGYRLYWGALDVGCPQAVPPVADTVVTVSLDGSPLDGWPQQSACQDASVFVPQLSPGIYQLRAEGLDGGGTVQFCEVYDVKVGAGVQPAYSAVVPTLALSTGCVH